MIFPKLYQELIDSFGRASVTGLPVNPSILLESIQGAYDGGNAVVRHSILKLSSIEVVTEKGHIIADCKDQIDRVLRVIVIPSPDTEYERGQLLPIIKTYANWKGSLSEYLQIGDIVDQEIADYYINVLPPAYWSDRIIQMGEPYSHREKGATYSTIKKTVNGWAYCGHCYRGQTDNIE